MAVIYDIDGNAYNTVVIGNQEWIIENLRTTRYADGTAIPEITTAGYSDWFMPSLDELNEMYTALHLFGLGNFKHGIFDHYWTSTEADDRFEKSAFSMKFSDGSQWESLKSDFNGYYIRPIRRFTAAAGAYSLRGIGPAGGRIFYISGGTTYYEAAQNDIEEKAWSNVTALAVGTTLKIIGEGINNTTEIIAQPGHTDSAAKLCDDLVFGGWLSDIGGAYCWYNNNIANKTVYGALYNAFAISNIHGLVYFEDALGVEQTGWRVPTYDDFIALQLAGGGWTVAGGVLKEVGTIHWNSPNTGAVDTYGFKAVPAGFRSPVTGAFVHIGNYNNIATSEIVNIDFIYYGSFRRDNATFPIGVINRIAGQSIRCVKDYIEPTTTAAPTTTPPPMRGITISHSQPTRVTSTDLIPSVTFVVNPGIDGCFGFIDMFISASYKPYTVELSVNKDFTDSVTVPQSKIITYSDRWYHIKNLPRTPNNKLLIGGSLYVKINFEDNTKFYDLKFVETGFKEIIGG